MFFQIFSHGIQYQPLISTPKWRSQDRLRTVAADPVDDDILRKELDTVSDQFQIFFQFHGFEGTGKVNIIEIRSFEDVKKLQLDPVNVFPVMLQGSQILYCIQNIFFAFTRKSKDYMDDNRETGCFQSMVRIFKNRKFITAADKFRRFFMDCLKT